jgi:hypothetical protein
MQWPIRSRKSEKDRRYNGQSEAVIQREADYAMASDWPLHSLSFSDLRLLIGR